jgi:hypothetical protein
MKFARIAGFVGFIALAACAGSASPSASTGQAEQLAPNAPVQSVGDDQLATQLPLNTVIKFDDALNVLPNTDLTPFGASTFGDEPGTLEQPGLSEGVAPKGCFLQHDVSGFARAFAKGRTLIVTQVNPKSYSGMTTLYTYTATWVSLHVVDQIAEADGGTKTLQFDVICFDTYQDGGPSQRKEPTIGFLRNYFSLGRYTVAGAFDPNLPAPMEL